MVASMVKPKWILELCWKCFYSGFHKTLECRDTKLFAQCCMPHNVSTLKGRANERKEEKEAKKTHLVDSQSPSSAQNDHQGTRVLWGQCTAGAGWHEFDLSCLLLLADCSACPLQDYGLSGLNLLPLFPNAKDSVEFQLSNWRFIQ
jgi:hypothetical protein